MNTQILFGIAVIPAIVGLVEVSKDLGLPVRAAPALAVLFGVLAAMAQLYANQWPWIQAVVVGVAFGLSACGLYSGAKTVISGQAQLVAGATLRPAVAAISDQLRELTPTPTPIADTPRTPRKATPKPPAPANDTTTS